VKKVLILFTHPALQKSRVNKRLIEGLDTIKSITFHDLYQLYPEFDIDIKKEQNLLEKHDIIVFHHPFFWYSTPALLKEWQDLVLQHDWAYGSKGRALKGKVFFNAITAGGSRQAYCREGYNTFTIRELLAPIENTARLCRMIYLPPFAVHGTHSISADQAGQHRKIYHDLLKMMRDENIDLEKAEKLMYLNDYFNE